MPVQGYRSFFGNVSKPQAPALGMSSGFTSIRTILDRTGKSEFLCRPSYVTVLNLRLEEIAQGAQTLKDLAVTTADGDFRSAEHVARLVDIASLLPGDVPSKKKESATFTTNGYTQPRSMILLEEVFDCDELLCGLRVYNLVFEEQLSLTRFLSVCLNAHDEEHTANMKRVRPLPLSADPRFAFGRLRDESQLVESLGEVFANEETAVGALEEYARRHPHAAHISLQTALMAPKPSPRAHSLHPFSAELLLKFGDQALMARTEERIQSTYLRPSKYVKTADCDSLPTFSPPALVTSYVFCGRSGAASAVLPPRLLADLEAAHTVHPPGSSWAAFSFNPEPAPKRQRTKRGADTESTTSAVPSL